MNDKHSNPCVRCGKERIDAKTWKEKITTPHGESFLIHTQTVCPDKECQKLVEAMIETQRKKTEILKADREERMKSRMSKKQPA